MTADDSYGRIDDEDYPDQLEEAQRINAEYRRAAERPNPPTEP
ncbi:hypothetical protein [Streptomyces rimosus]|nr:hypothetical protein [Streptomyces rimosus]